MRCEASATTWTGSHVPEAGIGASLDHRQKRHPSEHAKIFHSG